MQLFGDTAIQHLSSLALRCLVKNAGTQVCPHLSSVLERKLPVIVFNLDEPGVRAWISRSGTARIVLTGRCAATAVAAGWKWMIAGIGTSAFTTLVGAAFIVIFIYNGFKFALMGLGVIVDLFLGVFMLPFTAIAETINKTSYKGN